MTTESFQKKLVIIFAFILLALLSDRFIFTHYGYRVSMQPDVLRAIPGYESKLEIYKINLLGFKIPLSSVDAVFMVSEGSNLIEIHSISSDTVFIRSKGNQGEAVIKIYSLKTGLEIYNLLIIVLPAEPA